MRKTFKELHQEHKGKISDKWSLYLDEWDRLFAPYRSKEIRLLEIGIQNGGSLEVWGKFFAQAKKIVGCDIDQKCYQLRFDDPRIVIVVGDANSDDCEKEILLQNSKFDIIIDDGSHKSSDIVRSFARYFPHLDDDGIYVAEDLHSSYWEYFEGGLYNPHSSMGFFKRLTDIVNYEHWRTNKSRNNMLEKFAEFLEIKFDDLDLARIHSVEFINSLCVIKKSSPEKNVIGNRIVVGLEERITNDWYKNNATSIYDIAVEITDEKNLDVFELVNSVDKLNQTVTNQNEQIASLTFQLSERQGQIANLSELTVDLKEQIAKSSQLTIDLNEQIRDFTQTISEQEAEAVNTNKIIYNYESDITALNKSLNEHEEQIVSFNKSLNERDEQITAFNQFLNERDEQIVALKQSLNEREEKINELSQSIIEHNELITNLNQAISERNIIINNFENSNSWRLAAPLRKVKNLVNGKKNDFKSKEITGAVSGPNAFFTICSKNFLAHVHVLYNSLRPHYPNARFFVVLCDRVDGLINPAEEPFEFVFLEDLALPILGEMSQRYNITEFNTAVKPFAFSYLMEKFGFDSVVYLDPDLLFVDGMRELDQMLSTGAEAILTPHILQPAENDEIHDGKMLLFGIYNLGFLALRNTPNVRSFLSWWARRLEHHCIIRLEEGLFVDQKWADLLPSFVPNTKILHHPGYNVAYWNLPQRKITRIDNKWFANDQPLRFVHFSGNKIDDHSVFSRHSGQVTIETIGDLRELLDYYREQVFSHRHHFYRSLPYAFSWNGQSEENLHTPKSLDMSASEKTNLLTPAPNVSLISQANEKKKLFTKIKIMRNALPAAHKHSGGWMPLLNNGWRVYQEKGWHHVKSKIVELSGFHSQPAVAKSSEISIHFDSPKEKRILYIDWAIPKPDIDAASFTAMQLLKILKSLNYDVTFVPAGLKYEEGYYESLVAQGINVICDPYIESLEQWLTVNVSLFNLCVLARAPVVWPYLSTIKQAAPNLRLIFNTVDLHYLREIRRAELTGDEKLREIAITIRNQEFELIEGCDVTILLSSEELYEVRKECPSAALDVLPIVFDEVPGAVKTFDERQDILFIGSFPHLPNVDAVTYFAEEIFPLIQKQMPQIRFKIIGANPPEQIQKLSENPSIEILGYVKELRPVFENTRLSIVPLRYGAGIKGKIGTSFCYGVPCVATKIAIEGMGLKDGKNVLVGQTPKEFADAVLKAYSNKDLWQLLSKNGHKFANENYSVDVIRRRVENLLLAVIEGWQPIESLFEIDGWDSFQKHFERMEDEYERRILREIELLPSNGAESFYTNGYCCVCKSQTEFLTSFMYSTEDTSDGRKMPNWREHMQCVNCGFVNRIRAALNALFTKAMPLADSRIYITEQLTPTYKWFRSNYQNLQGSEYCGSAIKPGTIIDGIQHQDVMNLGFVDSSFDYVISFDVLEHVPFPEKAFKDIYRVLDSDGVFLFTVPFSADSPIDIVRASMTEDGNIKHHSPAEFHGNPMDPEGGALCYRYFGWELLEQLRGIGFVNVKALAYWSENQGYLGKEQFIFMAIK